MSKIVRKSTTSWKMLFALPNSGLRAYFNNVVSGSNDVYYGAFCDVETPKQVQHVLDEWSRHLSIIGNDYPTLLEFENEMKAKVGPMSIRLPLQDRMEDIEAYYSDIKLPAVPISNEALYRVVREFDEIKGLRLRSIDRTIENMRLSTNSGSPYFNSKRRNVLDDTLPITQLIRKKYLYRLNGELWQFCAVLGWRGQEGGPSEQDVKQRVVWMFPFAINILELQMYQPLIEACQKLGLVAPWISMEAVDDNITRLFDTKGSEDLVICTDFTKFDQHFNPTLTQAGEYIFSQILTHNSESEWWLNEVYPIKYHIPLAYNWEQVRHGLHGMGSGSGGTNADETFVHRALQHESAATNRAVLNPYSMCLGDDGVLSYPGISTEQVVRTYTSHGLEMNTSKQYASKDDCVFLRRWHHKDYRVDGKCAGVYSTYRALGRLMYRERMHKDWDEKKEALRTLSILENCKYHPLRDEFASFVMERDRYHLGKDIPGFLASLKHLSEEYATTMNDYISYTQTMQDTTDISSWWIVQYVLNH